MPSTLNSNSSQLNYAPNPQLKSLSTKSALRYQPRARDFSNIAASAYVKLERTRFELMKRITIFILALLAVAVEVHAANPTLPTIPSTIFNVTNYGAIGDGVTDNTTSIQNTINAASAAGGGIVEIPAGTYESGPITLYSRIDLQVDTNAMLQMLPLYTYPGGATNAQTFIGCNGVTDVAISGWGKIDGQGAPWWAYNATNSSIVRPMMLNLYNCNRLFIHDITYQNPPNHHCGLRDNGGNITISNLTVNTTANSPNTDGENFVATNSIIENCHISDGDDNIAMGSTGPIYDLLVTNCAFGSGHGLSFGSGISGVTNFTAINCTFNGTGNGLRIKCAQDNSLPMYHVNYFNMSMTNVQFPIVFYSYYNIIGTPDRIATSEVLAASNSLPINGMTPHWSNLTISNLTATSTDIGGIIWGPTEWPITNVTLINVKITAPKTFDLYNVKGVKVIDSQFNFSSGTTFTLCNADLTVSNSVPGGQAVTIGGATSTNSLSLYNVNASMSSSNAFGCNAITLSGSMLTNTGNLAFPNNEVMNFALGTNNAAIVVAGNLNLNGILNITNAGGFTNGVYTLFTYTGSLSGSANVGIVPAGYNCALDIGTTGQVKLDVTYTGVFLTPTVTTIQSSSNPSTNGTPVMFTATVSPAPTNGETVTFYDGSTNLGTGALNGGQASFTTTATQLSTGDHSITAFYGGDGAYSASTSSELTQTVSPPPVILPTGTFFNDTFANSTIASASPALPTQTSASYEVLSAKPWNPTPSTAPGKLGFGIGATSSGVVELQGLFASPAIALLNAGDFIQLSVTFTNTAGILSQAGFWSFGMYNSGGVLPIAGGLNATLNTSTSNAATGGAQDWQGYLAQIAYTGATSGFYDRKQQTGVLNNNQDLVSIGTSSSYTNPVATGIGIASTTPSVALTVGDQYTEVLTYTLTPSNALQLASQLYAGAATNGTLLSTMTATTTTPLATAFDSLAIGWRAEGSTASTMTISSITVTGQSTIVPPGMGFTVTGSTLVLNWPANYVGWSLQSNSTGLDSSNWVTVPASGNATNYSIAINPAMSNVFFRLVSP